MTSLVRFTPHISPNLKGAAAIRGYVRLSISVSLMSRSLLGGREHQIAHANVDIELNDV